MFNFFSIIALGFLLGMRHATDPDHVLAVTTIVSRQRGIARSAWIGAFWGMGHTFTILVVGAAIILFNLVIPPRLGLGMELAVGLMLILLGIVNVSAFVRPAYDPLPRDDRPNAFLAGHEHGDYVHSKALEAHTHAHPAPLTYMDRVFGAVRFYQYLRPLLIGVVHGLAGSAAVALLVLTTIRDPRWGVAYLLVFGVGTIAGMMVITVSLASTFHFIGKSRRISRGLAVASGALSLAFGLAVAYQIGFVDGLFTGHPNWTPH
jgi:high-affinity nickel-transport protein